MLVFPKIDCLRTALLFGVDRFFSASLAAPLLGEAGLIAILICAKDDLRDPDGVPGAGATSIRAMDDLRLPVGVEALPLLLEKDVRRGGTGFGSITHTRGIHPAISHRLNGATLSL